MDWILSFFGAIVREYKKKITNSDVVAFGASGSSPLTMF